MVRLIKIRFYFNICNKSDHFSEEITLGILVDMAFSWMSSEKNWNLAKKLTEKLKYEMDHNPYRHEGQVRLHSHCQVPGKR